MQNPKWSFTANIGLVGAIVSAWGVLVVLVTKLLMEKRFGVEFTRFQKWTVAISGIILIFWCITEDHLISYSLLQLSALIAYIPVIKKLWGAKHNPESLIFWGSLFLSTCVASYAAWERQDLESWIYIGRAIPASGTVLFLLIRLQLKYGS
ncbi:hypothetical protein H6776_02415 [Candidatus Nomurabacteria bacterium]|nr:hypothetical protein [Candidatus Nomurabacteria bacterium]